MPSTVKQRNCPAFKSSSLPYDRLRFVESQKPDLPYESLWSHYKPATLGCLRPGAVFRGTQSNHQHTYDVRIEFTVRFCEVMLIAECGSRCLYDGWLPTNQRTHQRMPGDNDLL